VTEAIMNKVHTIRMDLGMSQESLAKEIGVSRQTIVAIERGNYTPSVLLALKMAKFFEQPVEAIFSIKK